MKILDIEGKPVEADDPKRLLWYSAGCGYWTDDWDKLSDYQGIPICPQCGCPGMQVEAGKWWSSAEEFEKDHPDYVEFLETILREVCHKRGFNLLEEYKRWKDAGKS